MKEKSISFFRTIFLSVFLFGIFFFPQVAKAENVAPPGQTDISSIIIKLKADVTPEQRAELIARNGGVEVSGIPALRMYVIEIPSSEVEDALLKYKADPLVESAELNLKRKVEAIPSDLYYTTEQWALTKIGWESVFGSYTPQGTSKVAVLDTGVDSSHTELQGRILEGISLFDDSKGLTDPHGHGTWLAGIIAANTDNSDGIAGIAFSGVKIIPVKVISNDGTGLDGDIIQGIIWAVDNGADVILMGFSNPEKSTLLQDAIDYAWAKGAVLVASAGNDGQNLATFPAGHRGVIGVSATDQEDNLAPFSNYGDSIFLSAPGTEIAVTAPGNDYLVISGTSPSAAIVAGVAAFMKAVDPTLTNGIIVNRLARTADPAGTIEQTGNGRINMARALEDTSMDEIQPAGVDVGGGPIVGPYRVADKGLNIVFAGTGGGTITFSSVSPGTTPSACTATAPSTCSRQLDNYAAGTLTVTPNSGSTFVGWSGSFVSPGTTTCTGTTNPCTFSMGNKEQTLTATFSACTAPSISVHPQSQTKTVGDSVTFSVTASGTTPLSYQWRKNGVNITGATGSSYSISSLVVADAGSYDVVVSNACGSVTSNAAILTVNYPAPTLTSINPTSSTRNQTLNVTMSGSNFISGVSTVNFGPGITVNSTTVVSSTQITANITVTLSAALGARNVSVTNPPPGGGTATLSNAFTVLNSAPVANNQSVTTNEDTSVSITLTASDIDNDVLSYIIVSGPSNGTLTGTAPNLTYTPKSNYHGSDSFTFKVNDGTVDSNIATVSITINPVNDPPVAVDNTYNVNEDETLTVNAPGVLGNDNDVDGDTITAVLVDGPSNAKSFTLNLDGSFTYTPKDNFNGTDSFTYKASDGTDYSNVATVTITVIAVNDAPVANNDLYNVNEDETLNVSAPGVLGNDNDFDLDTLTVVLEIGPSNAKSFTLNLDGSFTYTPKDNFNGTDSFTYKASDGTDYSNVATVTITVIAVNDAPVANNDEYTVDEDNTLSVSAQDGLLKNDTDIDSTNLTVELVQNPQYGELTLYSDGSFIYTPNQNFYGNDTFTYRASDGSSYSNEAMVTITVNPVNDAPVLSDVPKNAEINELSEYTFTAKATDVDYPPQTLTFSLIDAPAGASIDSSTGVFTWTPSEEQGPGEYTFKVRVTDDGDPALYDEKTITITVNEVNVAPTLTGVPTAEVTIDEMALYNFDAHATDPDIPAQTLTFSLIGAPSGASINPSTGVFTWTPTEAQGPGTYTFTVRVSDGFENTDQSIKITVSEVNRKPDLTNPGNKSTVWGNTLSFTLSATDPDIPVNTLTYSISSGEQTGMTLNSSTGAFSWTPTSSQVGSYNITFKVTDNGSPNLYDEETITITVGKRTTTLIYNGSSSVQYSDLAALSATLTDNGTPISGATITFTIGSQSVNAVTNSSGVASTSLNITQAPDSYNVVSSFAGNDIYLPSNDSDPFTITQEDALAYYTGDTFVSTGSSTSSTATVVLSATIKDISAEDSSDPNPGDIRNAKVTFVIRNGSSDTPITGCTNLPVGLVSSSDKKVGTASCNWTANIGSSDSVTYTIGTIVNNYYKRDSSDDNWIVTVSKSLNNFITGGGYIINNNSAGICPGGSGKKTNFGFNVKYNKSLTNLQGNMNIIVRSDESCTPGFSGPRVYQIKANAIQNLTVNSTNRTATFTSKANIQDVTDPYNPIPLGGNGTLRVTMKDNGEPGNFDEIGITFHKSDGGLWFSSNWDGSKTINQRIDGGNLVVR